MRGSSGASHIVRRIRTQCNGSLEALSPDDRKDALAAAGGSRRASGRCAAANTADAAADAAADAVAVELALFPAKSNAIV